MIVKGHLTPRKVSNATKHINPRCKDLIFIFLNHSQFNVYPTGTRTKPKVIKITMQKCKIKTISDIK